MAEAGTLTFSWHFYLISEPGYLRTVSRRYRCDGPRSGPPVGTCSSVSSSTVKFLRGDDPTDRIDWSVSSVQFTVGCTGRSVRPIRTAVAPKCSSVSISTVNFSPGDNRTGGCGGSVSSVKSTGEFTGRALQSIRSVGSAPRKNFTVELDTDEQVPTGGPVRGPSHRYERDRRDRYRLNGAPEVYGLPMKNVPR